MCNNDYYDLSNDEIKIKTIVKNCTVPQHFIF